MSKDFSSVVCGTCLGDLESSIRFQQMIIANQQRLQDFESSINVFVKEEPLEAFGNEIVETIDIKPESYEFAPAAVVESWQQSTVDTRNKADNVLTPDDVPRESSTFIHCDSSASANSYLVEDPTRPHETSFIVERASSIRKSREIETNPTDSSKQTFECNICHTLMKTRRTLKVHMKSIHMGIRRFECKNCSKTWYHKQNMIYHIKQNVCQKVRKYAKKKILIKEENL